jgi:putative acetyltransferase
VQIEPRTNDDPGLLALVAAQQRELAEAEAFAGGFDGGYALHDDVRFLALRDRGAVVAIGAIQAVDDETAEIKRMYVVPHARGKGYGRTMLAALEEYAAARGHTRTRLETGSYLPVALGLYRAAGYRAIPAFGEYVGNQDSRCFEKDPIDVTMAFHERAGRP